MYTTDHKDSMESWCVRWNININEDKTKVMYFSRRLEPVEGTLKGPDIVAFVKSCKIPRRNFR